MNLTEVKKRRKRFVALLLTFVIVVSLMPKLTVEAATSYNTSSESDRYNIVGKVIFPGDTFSFEDGHRTINYFTFDGNSKTFNNVSSSYTVLDYSSTSLEFGTNTSFRCWYVDEVNISGGAAIVLKPLKNDEYSIKYVLPDTDYMNSNPKTYLKGTGVSSILPITKYNWDSDIDKTFNGWYMNSDFSGSPVSSISTKQTGDITLYGLFEGDNCNIVYKDSADEKVIGSSGSSTSFADVTNHPSTYKEGIGTSNLASGLCDAIKPHYTFDGWYLEKECTNKITGISRSETGDVTLWAKFTPNDYDINYTSYDGSVESGNTNPVKYTYGTTETINNLTKTGYTFDGWYGKNDFSGAKVTSITSANIDDLLNTTDNKIHLFAKFTPNTATLSLDNDGATSGGTASDNNLTYDSDMPNITIPQKDHYTFFGYYNGDVEYVNSDGTWNDISNVIENGKWKSEETTLSLKAHWTGNKYKIKFVDDDGTTVLKNEIDYEYETAAANIEKPADPTKTANAEYSYTFAGWTPAITDVTGNQTYKATYNKTKNKYNVTFFDEDGTTVLKAATIYDYGTAAADIVKPADPTKTANAEYTYTFAGWEPALANVTGDQTYKAIYNKTKNKYNVTFFDEDGTTVLKAATAYDYGTAAADIVKPANPTKASTTEKSYTFTGWSPAVANVTSDATYTAQFSEKPRTYKVSFDGNGSTTGTMGDEECDYGVPKNLDGDKYEKKGYEFIGWNTNPDGSGTSYSDKGSITVNGDVTLYAQWRLKNYSIKYVTKMGEYFDGSNPSTNPTGYTFGNTITVGTGDTSIADAVPNSENYTFEGWYTNSNFTGNKFAGITSDDVGDVTLYAKYTPKSYSIKYIIDGDAKIISGNPNTYDYGTGVKSFVDYSKEGYTFEGWYKEETFDTKVTNIESTQSGDVKLYGKIVIAPQKKIELTSGKTENDVKGAKFVDLLSGVGKCTKHSIKLRWKAVEGADGYMIYGNQCNHDGHKYKYKHIKTLDASNTSWTAKKLRKNKYYKYYIAAFRIVNGKKEIITVSKTVHATTLSKKYGIAEKVVVNKDTIELSAGGKFTIKAKEVNVSKKIQVHRAICFESSDTDIATVNKKGVVTAVSPGECTIYVFAQNGKYATCKVIVQ